MTVPEIVLVCILAWLALGWLGMFLAWLHWKEEEHYYWQTWMLGGILGPATLIVFLLAWFEYDPFKEEEEKK